jgi:hypothetical protein
MAYLSGRQGAEAVAEFRKILHDSPLVWSDPVVAVARLQLARALVLSGNAGEAKAIYQSFLALWKHADPGVPILKQAKAEYARLP